MNRINNISKRKKSILTISFLSSIMFFAIGLLILMNGHLHEDAYILFKYVKNINSGLGIVYNSGSYPTEGVTDFLWMILISIISIMGFDIAVSALILNSFGLFIICYVLINNYLNDKLSSGNILISMLIGGIIIISPLSQASLGGFSTLFFSAFSILLFDIYFNKKEKYYLYIPFIALIQSLIRPEGIIIGFVFTLLVFIDLFNSEKQMMYLFNSLIVSILGIIYFIWRYNYFGELLPLPFFVKTNGSNYLPGLIGNINWIKESKFILLITVLTIPLLKNQLKKFFYSLLPFIIFFLFLLFFENTQNIAFRYQAPITIVLLYVTVLFLKYYLFPQKGIVILTVAFLVMAFISFPFARSFKNEITLQMQREYINYFPQILKNGKGKIKKIALTETGRMAFWTNFEIIDLVGLNNKYCAKNKLDISYIEKNNPDIIFVHTDNTLMNWSETKNYFETEIDTVLTKIRPEILREKVVTGKVRWATLTVYNFLKKNNKYKIYLVKYMDGYNHLFAVKKDNGLIKLFQENLNKSFELKFQKPYFEMIGN